MRPFMIGVHVHDIEMIVTHITCPQVPDEIARTLITEFPTFEDAVKLCSLPHMCGPIGDYDALVALLEACDAARKKASRKLLAEGTISEIAYPIKQAQLEAQRQPQVERPENLMYVLYNNSSQCGAFIFQEGEWHYHVVNRHEGARSATLKRCANLM